MKENKGFRPNLKTKFGQFFQQIESYLPFGNFFFSKTSTPYTYLYRDVDEYLDRILDFGKKNGSINILNVGCASGEEAYSIITLCHNEGVNVSITAVDISAEAIAVGNAGIFDWDKEINLAKNNSDTPEVTEQSLKWMNFNEKYFAKTNGLANAEMTDPRKVIDSIKKCVTFKVGNLAELNYENEFDFVVCRKMLYYLPVSLRVQALENMLKSLKVKEIDKGLILDPYTLSQPFVIEWLESKG